MKLTDYIKDCLKNPEFKKYWEEDIGEVPEEEKKEESFSEVYNKLEELFESEEEYKSSLTSLLKDKGIKGESVKSTIEFYETDNGKCPVEEFINNIPDQKLKEKTVKNIFNLSEYGSELNKTPLSRYIRDGIYELRSQQSNNIDRIFYFFVAGNKIILTNGYIKKDQAMDKKEFKKAMKYRDDYSRR